MCGSMVDIQFAAAQTRRGKKDRTRKKKETTGQKYNGLPYFEILLLWPAVTTNH